MLHFWASVKRAQLQKHRFSRGLAWAPVTDEVRQAVGQELWVCEIQAELRGSLRAQPAAGLSRSVGEA